MKAIFIVLTPFVLAILTIIGAISFSFYPAYLWVTQVVSIVTFILIILGCALVYMLEPVAPFLSAKWGSKSIWFILQKNGQIVMKVAQAKHGNNDIDGFGSFLDNQHARKVFAGMPAYQVFEDCAVPPETDTILLCERLENAGINSFEEWNKAPNAIKYSDLDLKSPKRYFNNLNPNFVNVRIERIAAELSKEYRQAWKDILPWISIMLVGLIFAAISYVIITSVTSQPVPAGTVQPYQAPAYVPAIGN